ncbi:MAG: M28 family peptidase, partial [Bacteroidales bacterium]
GIFLCLFTPASFGQYTPWHYWTLLPDSHMQEIVGEASGETAYKTIMETGGYTRNRRPEEYVKTFYESAYIYDKLQWYGIPGAQIVRLPAGNSTVWNGIKGELWEISPRRQKLVSYRENAFQLVQGSSSADVKAELVWVGGGTTEEVIQKDVNGKIAVGHGNAGRLHANAVGEGAHGVIAISDSRNYFDPLQIPQGYVRPVQDAGTSEQDDGSFAFQMNIREGRYLRDRLLRGEIIEVHAQVETNYEPYEIQNVEAYIPGKDPDATAVILSAHIFEGLVKQGANDNKSGGAAILEVARVLNTLIGEGRIPPPKRSIRFWWGPEFSGSRPWVEMNFDQIKDAYCNINMDMVGEWLTMHNAYFNLMRTTFGNAHYVNDVVENFFRFVGEGNRDRVHNRREVNSIPRRIVAPFGADEPFHYSIETHYGSSDHVVFNDFGVRIPGVMMIAWPDQWYHTSGDLADKADPTQLKRAVVIAAAAAYTIANADDDMAVSIAGEITGNAARRLGHQLNVGIDMINSANAEQLPARYKKAVWLLEAHIINERATLKSVNELVSPEDPVSTHIEDLVGVTENAGRAYLTALEFQMKTRAVKLGTTPATIALNGLENQADSIIPELTEGSFKGGRGILAEGLSAVSEDKVARYPVISRIDRTEIARLINGENSALTIKKMLDAQNRNESDLQDIVNFLYLLKEAGIAVF